MQTYLIKIKFKAVNYVNKPKNACYYSACKGNT